MAMMDSDELLKRWKYLNGCHFVNLSLRRDGADILQQGDWLKGIIQELLERRGAISPRS